MAGLSNHRGCRVPPLKLDYKVLHELQGRRPDIIRRCEHVDKVLHGLKDYQLFDEQEYLETHRQFRKHQVFITVSGRHNTGKSTLLNSLFGLKILPVKWGNETGVKVIIQHDERVHGYKKRCRCSASIECDGSRFLNCPRLLLGDIVVRGVKAIHDRLKALNKAVRDGSKAQELVLTLHIPLLTNGPLDWRVSLVDTPGFGENDPITALEADRALKAGTAHLYVVNKESLRDTVDAKFYQELEDKDKGAFDDNRLAVVVTQVDTVYELGDSAPDEITDEIRSVSCTSISRATRDRVSMSSDAIILMSGKWALAARMMESCLPDQQSAVNKVAIDCLSKFPGCPCGQGESKRESLASLNPTEVAKLLENASGIDVLEKRIQHMSEACYDIWLSKMRASFRGYLVDATAALEVQQRTFEKSAKEDQEKLDVSFDCHFQMLRKTRGQDIQLQLDEAHSTFTEAYNNDLKGYPKEDEVVEKGEGAMVVVQEEKNIPEVIEEGKGIVHTDVEVFKQNCGRKIKDKEIHFGPSELNDELERFLNEIEGKVDGKFSACRFSHCHGQQLQSWANLSSAWTVMHLEASQLCGVPFQPLREVNKEALPSIPRKPPSLADVKTQGDIPPVTLSLWQRFKKMIWSWFLSDDGRVRISYSYATEDIPGVMHKLDQCRDRIYERCDKYFEDIKPLAIKYCVQCHCKYNNDQECAYNTKFKVKVAKKEREMETLRESISQNKEAARTLQAQQVYLYRVMGLLPLALQWK